MKQRNKQLILAGFIVFIMVMSTLGFIYGENNSRKYNGYSFRQTDQGWIVYIDKIGNYQSFIYLPSEVEDLGYLELNSDFAYIVDNGNLYYADRLKNFLISAGVLVRNAKLNDQRNETEGNETVADCFGQYPVFILNQEEGETSVYRENNCIYLNGNLNKAVDFIGYLVFGIIK
jgi:hypothetical protein